MRGIIRWLTIVGISLLALGLAPVAPRSQGEALQEAFNYYRATDPEGYSFFTSLIEEYYIPDNLPPLRFVDRQSDWYVNTLPPLFHGAGMFVYDTPTIWVDSWDFREMDQGMTISTLHHEMAHILSRWYPDYLIEREGVVPPPVDISNWRTWAEQEVFAANLQYRVAVRLGGAAGVQFAKDVARIHWRWMPKERQQLFWETYGTWLEPGLTEGW